jgi:hypothetical protein
LPAALLLLPSFAVLLQARDGITLPSYLTLPPLPGTPNTLLPENPKPSGPGAQAWGLVSGLQLPLVLFVHGGPWARDSWGLDSTAQWFANRGYAVLQVRWLLHACLAFALLDSGCSQGCMHPAAAPIHLHSMNCFPLTELQTTHTLVFSYASSMQDTFHHWPCAPHTNHCTCLHLAMCLGITASNSNNSLTCCCCVLLEMQVNYRASGFEKRFPNL